MIIHSFMISSTFAGIAHWSNERIVTTQLSPAFSHQNECKINLILILFESQKCFFFRFLCPYIMFVKLLLVVKIFWNIFRWLLLIRCSVEQPKFNAWRCQSILEVWIIFLHRKVTVTAWVWTKIRKWKKLLDLLLQNSMRSMIVEKKYSKNERR